MAVLLIAHTVYIAWRLTAEIMPLIAHTVERMAAEILPQTANHAVLLRQPVRGRRLEAASAVLLRLQKAMQQRSKNANGNFGIRHTTM